MSAALSTLLAGYFAGLGLVLVTPGPNLLLIGGLAALRGFRATLPVVCGLGCGAAVLGCSLYTAAGMLPDSAVWNALGRVIAACFLGALAWRLARAPTPGGAPDDVAAHADFSAGFATAVVNPVTGLFFAAQFVGPAGDLPWRMIAPLLLISAALIVVKALLVAALLSHDTIRCRVIGAFRLWSGAVAGLFLLLALHQLRPVLAMASGFGPV